MDIEDFWKNSRIIRSKYFHSSFEDFKHSKSLEIVTEKKHRLGNDLGTSYRTISYRIINHWESLGLIKSSRQKKTGWRKFSLSDYVWLAIITSLRGFGIPNERILNVKNCLIDLIDVDGGHCPLFEYYITLTASPETVFITLYGNDFSDIATEEELRESEKKHISDENIVRINLSKLVKSDFNAITFELTRKEAKLLMAIRKGDVESIKIHLKNGKIERLDKTSSLDAQTRIIDILKEADYQDVEIKKTNGKIVSMKRILKEKL